MQEGLSCSDGSWEWIHHQAACSSVYLLVPEVASTARGKEMSLSAAVESTDRSLTHPIAHGRRRILRFDYAAVRHLRFPQGGMRKVFRLFL